MRFRKLLLLESLSISVEKPCHSLITVDILGLDVIRTDRTLVFYEKQQNLSKLWDILAVYAWIDKDIGYCQGMYIILLIHLKY